MTTGAENRAGCPLDGFEPLDALWDGPGPVFPSEQSARWQLRQLRPALLQAGALARWCGRLYIHRARFRAVAEQTAIAAARR
jgi:hypothetical protein